MSDAGRTLTGSTTILVVDDEESIRRLAERVLTDAGYRVLMAASGEECLRLYRENAAAIALTTLDFSMPPGMNGEQTFDAILDLNPMAKVLLSSGSVPFAVQARMIGKGLCDVLLKPYSPRQLVEAVAHAVSSCGL